MTTTTDITGLSLVELAKLIKRDILDAVSVGKLPAAAYCVRVTMFRGKKEAIQVSGVPTLKAVERIRKLGNKYQRLVWSDDAQDEVRNFVLIVIGPRTFIPPNEFVVRAWLRKYHLGAIVVERQGENRNFYYRFQAWTK